MLALVGDVSLNPRSILGKGHHWKGKSVMTNRLGGILLHPTSLPGMHGIGEIGKATNLWIDWLADAGCSLWQILPLGPTGYGDSPYQSFSSFAGNTLLIDLDRLIEEGLLSTQDLDPRPEFSPHRVDYSLVMDYKERLLALASERYLSGAADHLKDDFELYCEAQAAWLDDFALFMALKKSHQGVAWPAWGQPLVVRQQEAVERAAKQLGKEVEDQRFRQFIFFRQWEAVRQHAAKAGVTIIGDIPFFTAHDSADVWPNHDLFQLDETGEPIVVSGVPPDYFSSTGQRWGNPHYRWDILRAKEYRWWIDRFKATLEMVDIVRLDHFRGFEASWEIPGDAPTAEIGRWAPGPGRAFLQALEKELGELPIIAEDLGIITPEVTALRDEFNLPGMKILQFGFEGDPQHDFLPHNYPQRCVAYTGTHDNDTSKGWYDSAPEGARAFCRRYLGSDGRNISWDMIRALWASVAEWVVVPLQDVFGMSTEARMNYPGTLENNWRWRFTEKQLSQDLAVKLRDLSFLYGRMPTKKLGSCEELKKE